MKPFGTLCGLRVNEGSVSISVVDGGLAPPDQEAGWKTCKKAQQIQTPVVANNVFVVVVSVWIMILSASGAFADGLGSGSDAPLNRSNHVVETNESSNLAFSYFARLIRSRCVRRGS